ncbi:MAG: YggT family protein [Lutisporaceae bacterium]
MYTLLIKAVSVFFQLINLLLLIRVILSLVKLNNDNKFVGLLYILTEPILEPFRKLTKKFSANQMVDWSPLIAMLCIQYILQPLVYALIGLFF